MITIPRHLSTPMAPMAPMAPVATIPTGIQIRITHFSPKPRFWWLLPCKY